MKNRRPCGTCSGCCRNCPYLKKKTEKIAGSKPNIFVQPLLVPAMAEIVPEPVPVPFSLPEPADGKTAIVPETPPDSFDKSPSEPALADFLALHPEKGSLRVQTFRGPQALPVEGVHVTVSRDFDGKPYIFYEGDTDMSGIIDQIVLPAAGKDTSLKPDLPQPSATYRLRAEHPAYSPLETTVDIYENVKTIQLLQLALRMEE